MFKNYLKKLNFPESYVSIILGFLIVVVGGLLVNNYMKSRQGQINTPDKNSGVIKQEELKLAENLPTTYTVSESDTLWSIAEKYYGSGYNWVTIAKENKLSNANKIEKGQVLNIPKAEVIKPGSVSIASSEVTQPETYTVVKGDYLWKIAVEKYGDGYAWVKIAKANKLVNPNLIHAGNVLQLPK